MMIVKSVHNLNADKELYSTTLYWSIPFINLIAQKKKKLFNLLFYNMCMSFSNVF